jgi:hypothetical protein cdivTM_00610
MIKNLELKVINGEKVSAACTGQLGQAACATCIAAPDCPILRLKKAQAEQIPTPNRKSYLDDLISDDNTIIAAGYRKKLQPKVLPIIAENHEKKPKPKPKKIKTPEKLPPTTKASQKSILMLAIEALEGIARQSIR